MHITLIHIQDENKRAEFKRAFSLFDKNGDGHISSSELAQVMKQLGQRMSDEDLAKMLREVDTDNSGSIEFDEFCVYMCNKMKPANSDDIKKKTFNVRRVTYVVLHIHMLWAGSIVLS